MADVNTLLGTLQPYKGTKKVLVYEQSTNDIINGMLKKHYDCTSEYNKLYKHFAANSSVAVAKKAFKFLKENCYYNIEPEEKQTLRTPAAILATGNTIGIDCKNYSLFIAGLLDAHRRATGKDNNVRFRYGGYNGGDIGHVFVVFNEGNKEYWADPVLSYFDSREQTPTTYKDKKIKNMALVSMAGIKKEPLPFTMIGKGVYAWDANNVGYSNRGFIGSPYGKSIGVLPLAAVAAKLAGSAAGKLVAGGAANSGVINSITKLLGGAVGGGTGNLLNNLIGQGGFLPKIMDVKGLLTGAPGSLFNPGFTSDIKARAAELKQRPVDAIRVWPPGTTAATGRDSFMDFFINFADDWRNPSAAVTTLPHGGRVKFQHRYVWETFTPTEWDAVVDKVKQASPMLLAAGAQGWTPDNIEYFKWRYTMIPWLERNNPQVAEQSKAFQDIVDIRKQQGNTKPLEDELHAFLKAQPPVEQLAAGAPIVGADTPSTSGGGGMVLPLGLLASLFLFK